VRTKTVDHFIDEAIKEKNFHFDTSFRAAHHAHTSFYPLAFDRSGRPGATTLRAIDGIKKMLLHFSQSSASKYSVEQALTDRISVAFQSGLGRHVSVASTPASWRGRPTQQRRRQQQRPRRRQANSSYHPSCK